MCGSMVDIQCLTPEIRRGNKKRRKKKKPQDENIYVRILLCRAAISKNVQEIYSVILMTTTHLKATKKLIYKKLYMIVRQLLRFDNITKVGTHQMCHKVPAADHHSESELQCDPKKGRHQTL